MNIFNQLVKRLTCFQLGKVDGLNQILVLKYTFFIPLHGDDFFLRSHSERTILLQYMFQIRPGLFAPSRGTQGKKSALDYP